MLLIEQRHCRLLLKTFPVQSDRKAKAKAVRRGSDELANAVSRQWVVQNCQAESKSTAHKKSVVQKIASCRTHLGNTTQTDAVQLQRVFMNVGKLG